MYRLRLLISAAGAFVLFAACGSSASPDRVIPELRSILRAGLTTVSCAVSSSDTSHLSPEVGCVPRQSVIADLSAADDGQRLAVQYLDGHVVVWDLRRHLRLLWAPPGPTQDIWLTAGGDVLARDVGSSLTGSDILQLWRVGPRPVQRPAAELPITTDWVWLDSQARRMLILPNLNATEPDYPETTRGGLPPIILYDLLHGRDIATGGAPSVPTVMGTAQPPVIGANGVSFDRIAGTFVISSEAQMGFITWKPGSLPVPTRANCDSRGTVTNDGRLFACVSGPMPGR